MSKPKAGFYWCASCGGCEELVLDLAEDLLVDRELVGADRAEVGRIEGDDQLVAGVVSERDLVLILVEEREVRSLGAGFDHLRRPSSATSSR